MTDLRDDYDLPRKPPLPFRQAVVMFTVVVLALGGWLLLPNSPLSVALLAIALLGVVFTGVAMVLRSRELDKKPGRNPTPPPSTDT